MSKLSTDAALRRLFWKLFIRGRALSRRSGKAETINPYRMIMVALTYTLIGVVLCLRAFQADTFSFSLTLHGATLFFITFQLVTTLGTVLFNKEEAEILLHRPVTPAALLRAKIFVLCAVSLMLAAVLNLAGMIAGVWLANAEWWFPLVHLFSLALATLFSASALVIAYQSAMRWFGRERLDNMMTTLQTALTVLLIVGSQAPRLIGPSSVQTLTHSRWLLFTPPAWFAAFDALLASKAPPPGLLAPAAAGIVITGLVAWLAFHRLAAAYGTGLMLMNEAGPSTASTKSRSRWLRRLLGRPPFSWWMPDRVERESFLLTAAYLKRDREVKLRIYPSLVQAVAMPLLILFTNRSGGGGDWSAALSGIYLGWLPLVAMQMLAYSEQWRAAELFPPTPFGRWPRLFHGARKAVLALLITPIAILLALAVLLLNGVSSGLLLLLPNLLLTPVWSLVPGLAEPWTPLSQAYDGKLQSQRGCLWLMFVMGVSAGIGGLAVYAKLRGWLGWFLLVEAAVAATVFAGFRFLIARRSD